MITSDISNLSHERPSQIYRTLCYQSWNFSWFHVFGIVFSSDELNDTTKLSINELLHTPWKMATSKPTCWLSSFCDNLVYTQHKFGNLIRWSGFFSSWQQTLSPTVQLPLDQRAFLVWWIKEEKSLPSNSSVLYLSLKTNDAILKYISQRTSYIWTCLAFHPYSQLIPEFCNIHGFDPLMSFTTFSIWS